MKRFKISVHLQCEMIMEAKEDVKPSEVQQLMEFNLRDQLMREFSSPDSSEDGKAVELTLSTTPFVTVTELQD